MASFYEKQIMSINEAAAYMNMSVDAFKEDFGARYHVSAACAQ